MEVQRLAVLGGCAALGEWTRAAAPVEHHPTARSDGHVVAGRAGDRAGMKVDREVVLEKPPGTAGRSGIGLII